MLHKAWSSIEEVPYCFWRSSVKFQGHTALKMAEFDPYSAFPDCNSSLNSPMAMKCCTKLETAKERCPIVFHGHPSNLKVTRDKTSPILTQIGRFRTIGRSQLSNPSDLPCFRIRCKKSQGVVSFHWKCNNSNPVVHHMSQMTVIWSSHNLSQCWPRPVSSLGHNELFKITLHISSSLSYSHPSWITLSLTRQRRVS